MRKLLLCAVLAALCLVLAACASSNGKAQAARSSLSAVARDPHVIAAEKRARDTVIQPCLHQARTVRGLIACLKSKVPPDKRRDLGKCLVQARLNGASLHDLETTAGAQCAAAALPPLNPSPGPSSSPAAITTTGNGL